MGRAKKIVSSTPSGAPAALAPVALEAALRAQLQAVKDELQRTHLTADPDKIGTSMLVAGLTQRLWALESMLAQDPNMSLAMSRQAAAWGEQHVRASKALQVDLLRDLFSKAEQMERHSGALKDLR